MIKIECEIIDKSNKDKACAKCFSEVKGSAEDVRNELRVTFMALEKSVGAGLFAEALDDWLTIEKGFKG